MSIFYWRGGPGRTNVSEQNQAAIRLTGQFTATEFCGVQWSLANRFRSYLAPARLPANEGLTTEQGAL